MTNTATTFEINPVVFSADYITTHLLPVVQRPTEDSTLMKEPFLDLELIFKVILKNDETGITSFKLTKSLAERYGMDAEYLKKCAWGNVYDDVTCQSMNEALNLPDFIEPMDMYILSNSHKNFGAGSAFICTLKLKELAEK